VLFRSWDGSRWGSEVWSITQFHNASRPLIFNITFNTSNGFTINYKGQNIATFPNRFNITNPNDLTNWRSSGITITSETSGVEDTSVNVYAIEHDGFTKMVTTDGKEERYYRGNMGQMSSMLWDSISNTGGSKYIIRAVANNSTAHSLKCERRDKAYCVFKDYNTSGFSGVCNAPTSRQDSYGGLFNYTDSQFTGWLDALYDRNAGSDPNRSERVNVVDYVKRCRNVPGYDYLKNTKAHKAEQDAINAAAAAKAKADAEARARA